MPEKIYDWGTKGTKRRLVRVEDRTYVIEQLEKDALGGDRWTEEARWVNKYGTQPDGTMSAGFNIAASLMGAIQALLNEIRLLKGKLNF